jgi:hypothetical protein
VRQLRLGDVHDDRTHASIVAVRQDVHRVWSAVSRRRARRRLRSRCRAMQPLISGRILTRGE